MKIPGGRPGAGVSVDGAIPAQSELIHASNAVAGDTIASRGATRAADLPPSVGDTKRAAVIRDAASAAKLHAAPSVSKTLVTELLAAMARDGAPATVIEDALAQLETHAARELFAPVYARFDLDEMDCHAPKKWLRDLPSAILKALYSATRDSTHVTARQTIDEAWFTREFSREPASANIGRATYERVITRAAIADKQRASSALRLAGLTSRNIIEDREKPLAECFERHAVVFRRLSTRAMKKLAEVTKSFPKAAISVAVDHELLMRRFFGDDPNKARPHLLGNYVSQIALRIAHALFDAGIEAARVDSIIAACVDDGRRYLIATPQYGDNHWEKNLNFYRDATEHFSDVELGAIADAIDGNAYCTPQILALVAERDIARALPGYDGEVIRAACNSFVTSRLAYALVKAGLYDENANTVLTRLTRLSNTDVLSYLCEETKYTEELTRPQLRVLIDQAQRHGKTATVHLLATAYLHLLGIKAPRGQRGVTEILVDLASAGLESLQLAEVTREIAAKLDPHNRRPICEARIVLPYEALAKITTSTDPVGGEATPMRLLLQRETARAFLASVAPEEAMLSVTSTPLVAATVTGLASAGVSAEAAWTYVTGFVAGADSARVTTLIRMGNSSERDDELRALSAGWGRGFEIILGRAAGEVGEGAVRTWLTSVTLSRETPHLAALFEALAFSAARQGGH